MITGCCCDCRTTTFTFQLCGGAIGSTPVTFTQGVTVLSGTTNAFGQVTFTFPSDGDWDYDLMIAGDTTGYGPLTGTVNVLCSRVRNAQTIAIGCSFPKVLTYSGSITQAQASFYFVNTPNPGPEPSTYTLTYGPRPSDIPATLQLLYFSLPGGVSDPIYIAVPDNAWFSAAIPAFFGSGSYGPSINVYFYAWRSSGGCILNVMVIDAPYGSGTAPTDTKGAGNNVLSYHQSSCVPFEMKVGVTGAPKVTGTHGTDDITDLNAGVYSNFREGLDYAVVMKVTNSAGVAVGGGPHGANLTAALAFTTGEGGGAYIPPSVSWGSSNTGVLTVAGVAGTGNAVITTVAAGTADVTATITDPHCTTPTVTRTLTIT